MVARITQPTRLNPITNEDGTPSNEFNAWIQVVTNRIPILGTGSPETVVSALAGLSYIDQAGALGSVLYIKQTDDDGLGDTTKGWVLIG